MIGGAYKTEYYDGRLSNQIINFSITSASTMVFIFATRFTFAILLPNRFFLLEMRVQNTVILSMQLNDQIKET